MNEENFINENVHTKCSVFMTQLYIMSIQPANKAGKHLLNS